jgi:LPS sulfotransferase NodH
MHLRGLLETRLQLAASWRKCGKSLEAVPIQRPVFITGMPRSGSTFLHELLAEDPESRAPRIWEVMFPVPAPTLERMGPDPRIRRAAACLWWFRRLAPGADEVFPMRATSPHECVAIQSYTLLSEEFISSCRIPSYEEFLRAADLRPAYVWEKRFLQHLQQRYPVRRWVLKSPDHVYGLEELFAVFPDAMVIQTHRNPLEVVKSSSQLTAVLMGLYARRGDREQVGAREARVIAEGMERFIRFRDVHPELEGRFIDVKYTDLVSDPMAVVRRVYEHLDAPLPQKAEERMRRLISNRSRYHRRHPSPRLSELGVEAPAETRRFKNYCSRFGVACQWAEPG